jgi:hypothetical protein
MKIVKKWGLYMKWFMQKNLVVILFCIDDVRIFCELPKEDKILAFHRKMFSLLFPLSLFYKVNIK